MDIFSPDHRDRQGKIFFLIEKVREACAPPRGTGTKVEGVGVMKDKELKVEETETTSRGETSGSLSHTRWIQLSKYKLNTHTFIVFNMSRILHTFVPWTDGLESVCE